ncbi:MAG TPA: hypothetical protein VLH94_00315 [Spirochaetia bacterium]|nr:hypothetical protein [Spirochaetia bacterium]
MVNQQLLDYINQQIKQGVSSEQIKQSLLANKWPNTDIEEAFSTINNPVQSKPVSIASNQICKIIMILLIGILVIGGVIYFSSQVLNPMETTEISNEASNPSPTIEPSEQPTKEALPQNTEIIFADNLSSCTKYKTTFKHPLTGETLEKEVLGIVDGKCNYVEQMPNGGKMECKFSENERVVVAQYYKDIAAAESIKTSVNANLVSGEQKATYSINDKLVDNPLQEATDTGVCVISGY